MNELERYFEKAKESRPVVSTQDIHEILNANSTHESKIQWPSFTEFFRYRWQLAGITAATASVLLLIYFNRPEQTFLESGATSLSTGKLVDFKREAFLNYLDSAEYGDSTNKIKVFYKHEKDLRRSQKTIPTLKVSQEKLSKMGFTFSNDEALFEANIKGKGYLLISLKGSKHSLTINDNPSPLVEFETSSYPLFISEMNGYQKTRFWFGHNTGKLNQAYFDKVIDDLVPIAIPDPQKSGEYLGIFWFESTAELFDKLTDGTLRSSIGNKPKPSISDLTTDIVIQNNPFSNRLNIQYTIAETTEASIKLISVDGNSISTLLYKTTISKGTHVTSFDLSALPRGLYLIQLVTSTDRVSKRIIKQ